MGGLRTHYAYKRKKNIWKWCRCIRYFESNRRTHLDIFFFKLQPERCFRLQSFFWRSIEIKCEVYQKGIVSIKFLNGTKIIHISNCAFTLSNFFFLLDKNSNLKRIHFSPLSYPHRNSCANECYRTYIAVHIYTGQ